MSLGFLEGALSIGERAALPYITHFAESTLSANSILRQLSSMGLGLNRSRGLALIRKARGIVSNRSYISAVNLYKSLNKDRLPSPLTKTLRTYSYHIEIKGTDLYTGEYTTLYRTYSTNSFISKGEAVNNLLELMSSEQENYPWAVQSAQVVNVLYQRPLVPGG